MTNSLSYRFSSIITFSQPNANLQEHYVLFEYLRHRLPVRTLILPLVFDGDPRAFHGYMPYDGGQPLSWEFTRI